MRISEVAYPGVSGDEVDVLRHLAGAVERTCFWRRPWLHARFCGYLITQRGFFPSDGYPVRRCHTWDRGEKIAGKLLS